MVVVVVVVAVVAGGGAKGAAAAADAGAGAGAATGTYDGLPGTGRTGWSSRPMSRKANHRSRHSFRIVSKCTHAVCG